MTKSDKYIEEFQQESRMEHGRGAPHAKLRYVAPELEVFDYVVEKGFANSAIRSTAQAETFSEINDNETGTRTIGGENYTGSWGEGTEW